MQHHQNAKGVPLKLKFNHGDEVICVHDTVVDADMVAGEKGRVLGYAPGCFHLILDGKPFHYEEGDFELLTKDGQLPVISGTPNADMVKVMTAFRRLSYLSAFNNVNGWIPVDTFNSELKTAIENIGIREPFQKFLVDEDWTK